MIFMTQIAHDALQSHLSRHPGAREVSADLKNITMGKASGGIRIQLNYFKFKKSADSATQY